MLNESLYRLYVSSNMFHPTFNSIHSFIRCQIKDGDGHAFASDTVRAGRLWWHQLGSFQNIIRELTVEDRYAFKEIFWKNVEDFETVYRWSYLSTRKTRSSSCINIRNNDMRMKCWMKQGVNRYDMKTVLDEPENVRWKICSRSNFHSTWFFLLLFLCSV